MCVSSIARQCRDGTTRAHRHLSSHAERTRCRCAARTSQQTIGIPARPGECVLSSPGVTFVTSFGAGLPARTSSAYAGAKMAPRMLWLVMVVRVTSAPVFLGALFMLAEPPASGNSLAAAGGLIVLGAIHVFYWWRPWPSRERQAIAAAAGVVVTNFVLLDLLGLSQPLLWLYPALIVGAGLRPVAAAVGLGLTALAAAAPMAAESRLAEPHDFSEPFGASHSILLSIVLAGLGMTAVRQLIAVNADLHATRAELADLAVAGERERLARGFSDIGVG